MGATPFVHFPIGNREFIDMGKDKNRQKFRFLWFFDKNSDCNIKIYAKKHSIRNKQKILTPKILPFMSFSEVFYFA